MKHSIIIASAQVRGIDGAGGLGDVPIGLANELVKQNDTEMRLAMPGYATVSGKGLEQRFADKNLVVRELRVPYGDRFVSVDVFQITVPQPAGSPRLVCYLFRCPEIFDQISPQTGEQVGKLNKDTPDKAVLFSRSVVEFVRTSQNLALDLVHCNDWQTALIPVYLKTLYRDDSTLKSVATVYTTHNAGAGFQGSFQDAQHWLWLSGLQNAGVFEPGKTRSLEHWGNFNFTKAGVGFADLLNTVSSTYRQELCSPAFAGGLEGVFRERDSDFVGIVNGIDYHEWNPATDCTLANWTFSVEDSATKIRNSKLELRSRLREWVVPASNDKRGAKPFAALQDDTVMIAAISRIDFQKAPILLRAIGEILGGKNIQLCMLGEANPNDPLGQSYADQFEKMAVRSSGLFLFFRGFDIPLSHLLYASSELFLSPSVFEPCGLTQLVAMRYGSVPVVRKTGGLADTVLDEADSELRDGATGFLFKEPVGNSEMMDEPRAADELAVAVRRALQSYRKHPERWVSLIKNCMLKDSSWRTPSLHYFHLYEEAIRRVGLRA